MRTHESASKLRACPFALLALGLLAGHAAADLPAVPAPPKAFEKAVPESLEDLKEIQDHVQQVLARAIPATVGLRVGGAAGSGVIISKEGIILTAGHVSGKPGSDVLVILPDGRKLKGKSLGANSGIDSGMIQITDRAEFPHVEMATSADLKKGQWCVAVGHPGGYQTGRSPVVRVGRILDANSKFLRTDCTLVGGDSGGPLFDMNGKVIGIHSRIGGAITFNIHVPVDTYRETWDKLAAGESWGGGPFEMLFGFGGKKGDQAYLGVTPGDDEKEYKVVSVTPDSPAAKAGLKENDVILKVDDRDITTPRDLDRALRGKQPGTQIMLQLRRGGEQITLSVTLGKRPA